MLALTKRTDYALIVLTYLSEHPGKVVSTRELAESFGMPGSLVMNIMKVLHNANMVSSLRGMKGGYRLAADLSKVNMHELIGTVEGPVRLTECIVLDGEKCTTKPCQVLRECPVQKNIHRLHLRVVDLLRQVKVSEMLGRNGHARPA
jgi:Rrf2 family protein